ncbi:Glycosyltransferase Family 15 protein [Trametes cinnabarina]|uniref:Glycosyltransferase Family 15 protein n=1 Tax=Pycnoporus cinnabarinus TaxID=5643 RepID=A0A060SAF6_PYCCI|nr:Glycosyltransferase Family 15 protein [Trametes cinnabarina]
MRYVVLVLAIIISLHFILSFSHEEYGRATSLSHLSEQFKGSQPHPPYQDGVPEEYYAQPSAPAQGRRANATFVFLARNGDLGGVVTSMKQVEDRFNKEFQYPYVFLNEEPFSDEFKERVQTLTDSKIEFGLIPKEDWVQPEWIDEERAAAARKKMADDKVIYGGSVPYRNMCRFNSGFFYRHELLHKYKYYWRVEPDVTFFCDLHYDPFLLMQDQKKVYGFTISLYEYPATIPTLWDSVKEFIKENPDLVEPDNAMKFISDDEGNSYNNCHFWSNFEIGDLDFWRGEAYSKFFDFLDKKGGFYYEVSNITVGLCERQADQVLQRWGDAPVHSIGAALFAKKDQIHFFNDIGYRHNPFQHCPQGELHKKGKCWCDPKDNFDYEWYSCLKHYDALFA